MKKYMNTKIAITANIRMSIAATNVRVSIA